MKTLSQKLLLALMTLTFTPAAMAQSKVDRVMFCGIADVIKSSGTEDAFHDEHTAIHTSHLVRGEVRIFEVDAQTLENKMTKIPAMLRITTTGATLRSRGVVANVSPEGCTFAFNIYGNAGKPVSSIFDTYHGGGLGVAALVNLGIKVLGNASGHYVISFENLLFGIGVNAAYTKFELRAGSKQTDQVEITNVMSGAKTTSSKADALRKVLQ